MNYKDFYVSELNEMPGEKFDKQTEKCYAPGMRVRKTSGVNIHSIAIIKALFWDVREANIQYGNGDMEKVTLDDIDPEVGLREQECGGCVTDEIPCESLEDAGLMVARDFTDVDKIGLVSAHDSNVSKDKEIYEHNLELAKELLAKINSVKDQRGARTKLENIGVTGSMISSIIIGLNYSGKGRYSSPDGKKMVQTLVPLLKKIFKVGVNCWPNRDIIDEALILKRNGDDILAVSDLESRQLQSAETFRHKNELKKNGFTWDSKLNSWKIPGTELRTVQQLLVKINKKPLEVIINTIDELPEFILNTDNLSRKQELASQIDGFIGDLSKEVTEAAMSEKIMQYLAFQRRFKTYSITNTILIYIQRPNSTKVAGFHAWKTKFNRTVKKGAKAITIFAPVKRKVDDVEEIDDRGLDAQVRQKHVIRFFPVSVFDIADTEAIDASGAVPESPEWHNNNEPNVVADKISVAAEQLATELGIKYTQNGSDRGEMGYSAGDHINITSNIAGVNKASTLLHEIAHELMHHKDKSLFYIEVSREVKELQAEAVSYVVIKHYNLPATHHSTYLALWNANKDNIEKYLKQIKDVSNFIIDKLDAIITEKDGLVNVKSELKEQLTEGKFRSMTLAGLVGAGTLISPHPTFATTNSPTVTHSHESRGIRNNNPGNIRLGSDKWNGIVGNDGQFLKFDCPENGIRALYKTIKTYNVKYKINTIAGIISRWAPQNENDTDAYIKFVSNKTGFKSNEIVDVHDKSIMVKLIGAIIERENGKNPYTNSVILAGVNKT